MGKRIGKLTNKCFEEAVKEVTGLDDDTSSDDVKTMIDFIRSTKLFGDLYDEEELLNFAHTKENVDDLYLQKILRLTSRQLEDIITVHEADYITRMPKTIEAILSELTRRSILGDSSKSSDPKSKVCRRKKK